jgi:hypothetical protein
MVDGSYQPIQSEDEIRRRLSDVNYVLIHPPKTAGGSVQAWFGDQYATGHLTALRLREILGDDRWRDIHKVGLVRNPWDRMVSWFHHHRDHIPFSSFAEWVRAGLPVDWPAEWRGQDQEHDPLMLTTWLCNNDGLLAVNQLIHFEALQTDCRHVAHHIEREYHGLSHRNATSHKAYWHYYDAQTREIVAERFARDIEMFNYAF